MSEEGSGSMFDVEQLRALAQLMADHDLSEVDLRQHGQTVRIRRGGVVSTVAAAAPVAIASHAPPVSTAKVADETDLLVIKSPMVGTFYSRPKPGSEQFVKVGQDISADTVVCIIEAMKVFNEIPAEISGTVAAILVGDEEPVEFGKPLFKVRPHS